MSSRNVAHRQHEEVPDQPTPDPYRSTPTPGWKIILYIGIPLLLMIIGAFLMKQ